MSEDRKPVSTLAELDTLDNLEMREGYLDGFSGEFSCGDNRSKSYWHGHRNGASDRTGKTDEAQKVLVAHYVAKVPRT